MTGRGRNDDKQYRAVNVHYERFRLVFSLFLLSSSVYFSFDALKEGE